MYIATASSLCQAQSMRDVMENRRLAQSSSGGVLHRSCGWSGVLRERIGKGVGDRIADHVLVILAQELSQAVGLHQILADHVRHCFGRDRRDPQLPERL